MTRLIFRALAVVIAVAAAGTFLVLEMAEHFRELESGSGRPKKDIDLESRLISHADQELDLSRFLGGAKWKYICVDRLYSKRLDRRVADKIQASQDYQRYEGSDNVWPLILVAEDGTFEMFHLAKIEETETWELSDTCVAAANSRFVVVSHPDPKWGTSYTLKVREQP